MSKNKSDLENKNQKYYDSTDVYCQLNQAENLINQTLHIRGRSIIKADPIWHPDPKITEEFRIQYRKKQDEKNKKRAEKWAQQDEEDEKMVKKWQSAGAISSRDKEDENKIVASIYLDVKKKKSNSKTLYCYVREEGSQFIEDFPKRYSPTSIGFVLPNVPIVETIIDYMAQGESKVRAEGKISKHISYITCIDDWLWIMNQLSINTCATEKQFFDEMGKHFISEKNYKIDIPRDCGLVSKVRDMDPKKDLEKEKKAVVDDFKIHIYANRLNYGPFLQWEIRVPTERNTDNYQNHILTDLGFKYSGNYCDTKKLEVAGGSIIYDNDISRQLIHYLKEPDQLDQLFPHKNPKEQLKQLFALLKRIWD